MEPDTGVVKIEREDMGGIMNRTVSPALLVIMVLLRLSKNNFRTS